MEYITKLGLPYMGSKRKLAKPIVDFILKNNPKTKYAYDLFGGGGAISFDFIQRPQIKKVFYNELNTGVVALLKDIQQNGITNKYWQWIDRKTFNKHKNDDDWVGGLCKVIWSFGNNQKDYLFGKDIEYPKKLLHNVIVENDKNALEEFNLLMRTNIKMPVQNDLFGELPNKDKRIELMAQVKKNIGRYELEQLERLERLQQLERLDITNLSYEKVKIETPIDETIIYLDPPYKNTSSYQKSVDSDALDDYIQNSPYKIYLSGYDSIFPCVLEIEHRSILSATTNNKVIEKLFVNRA